MGVEVGGRATKLGDTYERLWAVHQAVYVMDGRLRSLLWEPVGEDENGIDVWITKTDGTQVGHQLKRQNRRREYWTVADLREEGVLQSAFQQLLRNPAMQYVFISSSGARHLRDLAEQSHRTNDDAVAFYRDLVCANKDRKKAFHTLMNTWNLKSDVPADVDRAFRTLKRMDFHSQERTKATRDEVEFAAGLLIDGDPAVVVATLGDFLDSHLGDELHADELRRALRDRGFQFRRLAGEPSLSSAIESLQGRFDAAVREALIANTPIERPEARDVFAKITGAEPPRLVFMHGQAGSGKTAAAHELFRRLIDAEIPCLPLQLHTRRPEGTPDTYGRTKLGLPASPALSIRALAGNRRAVLILDQLDALRLTSVHSHEAWESCTWIIDEALADANTTVVVVCRSFDIENDPKIGMWRRAQQGVGKLTNLEVAVGELPEPAVTDLVRRHGVTFAELPARQQTVLRQPGTLALWWNLASAGKVPSTFESSTHLMRDYLALRRDEAGHTHNVLPSEVADVLVRIVAFMDERGRLDAPEALFAQFGRTVNALCSVGLLRRDGAVLCFVHQSYFDYLVAERVLSEAVQTRRDPLHWLKSNQSLFRRDQLRQLFSLLRDSDQPLYGALLRNALCDPDVRFHLKQLILGLLSQADPPLDTEVQLVTELTGEAGWWVHIHNSVIWSKPAWFDALERRDHLRRWLSTWNDEKSIRSLLTFFRSVAGYRGERIDALLSALWHSGEPWESRLTAIFSFDPSDDSDGMSSFRAAKIRKGEWAPVDMYLDRVAERYPDRVVPLLEAAVWSWIDRVQKYLLEKREVDVPKWQLRDEILDAKLIGAVQGHHERAWKTFSNAARILTTLRRLSNRDIRSLHDFGRRKWALSLELSEAHDFIEILVVASLQVMSSRAPAEMAKLLQELTVPRVRGLERAIARGMAAGADSLADAAMSWLSARPSRFCLGDGHEELYWQPATELLRRFALLCSEPVYENLEARILAYHDDYEALSVRRQYEYAQKGAFDVGNAWGRAQNHLLHALPAERTSERTRERLAGWRAKFGDPGLVRPTKFADSGGCVTSPIPPDKLMFVSDREWLQIIAREWPAHEGRRWKQHGPDVVGEASLRQFTDAFGHAAVKNPKRFARLAMRIPPTADPAYFASLLRAVGRQEVTADDKSEELVAVPELETIVEHVGDCRDGEYVQSVCRLIESRPNAQWSNQMVDRVIGFASHPEPALGEFTGHTGGSGGDEMKPDIEATSINCVRGNVAAAIVRLFWARSDAFDRLLPAATRLLSDPHPSVRIAALGTCLPIWNRDRDLALKLVLEACNHENDAVLRSDWLHRFIGYARFTQLNRLAPLIKRMGESSDAAVAEWGAAWATACWLDGNDFKESVRVCCSGSKPQRLGVVGTTVQYFAAGKAVESTIPVLIRAFSDSERDVRSRAAHLFYRDGVFDMADSPRLAGEFVESPSFADSPDSLLHPLSEHTGEITRYASVVLAAADIISGPLAEDTRNTSTRTAFAGNEVSTLLLRLYETAYGSHDRKLQDDCLDRWDRMLENRVGMTRDHLKQLDD